VVIPIPAAADSWQHVVPTVACQSPASSPDIRVIELHILGIQVRLRSINTGPQRRWPPSRSRCRPPNAAHRRGKKTINVELEYGFVTRCGRGLLFM
jgi:hypothetical protein